MGYLSQETLNDLEAVNRVKGFAELVEANEDEDGAFLKFAETSTEWTMLSDGADRVELIYFVTSDGVRVSVIYHVFGVEVVIFSRGHVRGEIRGAEYFGELVLLAARDPLGYKVSEIVDGVEA